MHHVLPNSSSQLADFTGTIAVSAMCSTEPTLVRKERVPDLTKHMCEYIENSKSSTASNTNASCESHAGSHDYPSVMLSFGSKRIVDTVQLSISTLNVNIDVDVDLTVTQLLHVKISLLYAITIDVFWLLTNLQP